jgi:tetratricopeptide (TPR) repeat protein
LPRPTDRLLPRLAGAITLGASLLAGLAAGAGTTAAADGLPALTPSPLGHYLASRHAETARDLGAAADLLAFALAGDPDNPRLLQSSFRLMIGDGRMADALVIAKRMESRHALDGLSRLALALDRVKAGDYKGADDYLGDIGGPGGGQGGSQGLERFLKPMLGAWTELKLKGIDAALATLAPLGQISGFEPLYEMELAEIEDVARRPAEAAKHYDRALETASDQAFRMIELAANFRLRQGNRKGAEALFTDFEKSHPRTFLTQPLRKALASGGKPQPQIANETQGLAEALFNLAVLLQSESSNDAALLLARLGLYIRGDEPIFQTLLADVLDAQSRHQAALAAYRQVPPDSPYGWQAQIKVADELQRLDRSDEGIAILQKLVDARSDRAEAAIELGDALRAAKRFPEAVKAYDKAIARLGTVAPQEWSVYYFRGIASERSGQWPPAERDFKKALQLQPDQPYVLNYLGYTWVDRGENLKEAIGMLQRAVQAKSDDGFIVDSLAWAYYRLGQFDKAVVYQEKAISLEPGDPTLNDHLGDIYWKLGRHNEARFQWQRALAFKPEADQVKPIEAKLQHGLKAGGG